MDFPYGETEIAYLRARDLKLGAAMDRIGPIHREVDPDLFSSVIHHIIGQQVSMAAQRTVWQRLQAAAGTLVPETVAAMPAEALQALGMTRRRALYILEFARKVASGDFDLDALAEMEDREVLARLTSLRGVGPWTAEMLLIFGLRRPDVVSWGDLAILRALPLLGCAMLESALARKESRGAHWRADYPQRNDAVYCKTTMAHWNGQHIAISFESIPERRHDL